MLPQFGRDEMDRITDWLRIEFHLQLVCFEERTAHGLVFHGVCHGENVMLLVPASQKVWLRDVMNREWTPTGVRVPDHIMP